MSISFPEPPLQALQPELNIWTHISYGMSSAEDTVSSIWPIMARDFRMPCVNLMAILYNVEIVNASNYRAFTIKSKVKLVLGILYRKRKKCNANFTFTNIQLRKLKSKYIFRLEIHSLESHSKEQDPIKTAWDVCKIIFTHTRFSNCKIFMLLILMSVNVGFIDRHFNMSVNGSNFSGEWYYFISMM